MQDQVLSTNLVSTLGIGVSLAFLVYVLLYRFTRMRGKQVGLIVAVLVLAFYTPYAAFNWQGLDVLAIHLVLYLVTPYGLSIITTHWEGHRELHVGKRWFNWAPAIIVMFLGSVAMVDAVIINFAENGVSPQTASWLLPSPEHDVEVRSDFPGVVPHDYQDKTEDYASYLERLEAQERLGWQLRKGFLGVPRANGAEIFQVEISDRDGHPLSQASVSGRFMRPSNEADDRIFQMREVKPGLYQASIELPYPGRWDLLLDVKRGDDLYEERGQTVVEPARGEEAG
ncbi:hypothetical protein BJI67_14690 [Acidihalobacter aeolianus]|uniref:Nitrogen fixation protein FixH n=1 Tax=Acidihalobacter aeolianus TaxID=2792603 RepID=A0A1D8KAZ4_9GAMM|nr:FixH family protein [Acidihalobacter aeolianus]AOV18142.1 hypothetical protein BJI67_14690 [Acidihalobacter aeolianus]